MSESARATEERGRRAIGVSASDSLAELHRAAILEAMVELVAERGYAETSLGVLLERAQVSRRTFYELFPSMEECFTAILDEGMTLMAGVTVHAFTKERHWLDGLLKAEAAVLSCLDSEPQMARALLVEALGVGSWALEHRERNIRQLRELVLEQLSNVSPTADFFSPPPSVSSDGRCGCDGFDHGHDPGSSAATGAGAADLAAGTPDGCNYGPVSRS